MLSYGGDEFSGGQGVLFLNKTDLIALGDVRGTNEKKAVYEITPDANPNTGIIKDGGLAVKYCICSALTACAGTSQSATAKQRTMAILRTSNLTFSALTKYVFLRTSHLQALWTPSVAMLKLAARLR